MYETEGCLPQSPGIYSRPNCSGPERWDNVSWRSIGGIQSSQEIRFTVHQKLQSSSYRHKCARTIGNGTSTSRAPSSQSTSHILSMPSDTFLQVGFLNVHSYNAKRDDVANDRCIQCTHIICFVETLISTQHAIQVTMQPAAVFRHDRPSTGPPQQERGGIMVASVKSLCPPPDIPHHPEVEINNILVTVHPFP